MRQELSEDCRFAEQPAGYQRVMRIKWRVLDGILCMVSVNSELMRDQTTPRVSIRPHLDVLLGRQEHLAELAFS